MMQDLASLTSKLSRRQFLLGSGALAAATAVPMLAQRADAQTPNNQPIITMDEIMQEMKKGSAYEILKDSREIVLLSYTPNGSWKNSYLKEVFQENEPVKRPVLVLLYTEEEKGNIDFSLRGAVTFKKLSKLYGANIKMIAINVPSFIEDKPYDSMYNQAMASPSNSMGIFATSLGKRKKQLPPARGPPTIVMYSPYEIIEGETPQSNDGKIKLIDMVYGSPFSNKDTQDYIAGLANYWINTNIFLEDNPDKDGKIYRLHNKGADSWKEVGNVNNIKKFN